ncbi:MAG: hypothetical protein NTY64_01525 [Deltaproteobacteria bacterium]|nr:hypothetical protein [Deltaproteobacteria bacterium]
MALDILPASTHRKIDMKPDESDDRGKRMGAVTEITTAPDSSRNDRIFFPPFSFPSI